MSEDTTGYVLASDYAERYNKPVEELTGLYWMV